MRYVKDKIYDHGILQRYRVGPLFLVADKHMMHNAFSTWAENLRPGILLACFITQMRIAIPEWDGYVSPVTDAAGRLLLVDLAGDGQRRSKTVALAKGNLTQRVAHLAELRIEVLICCSISHAMEAAVASRGIRVVRHICGPVEEILGAFLTGGVIPQSLIMPGCQRDNREWEPQPE